MVRVPTDSGGSTPMREPLRWLAVIHKNFGYALDAYPEEIERYRREHLRDG